VQRIFVGLAAVALLLLIANVFLGLTGGDYNAAAHAYYTQGEEIKRLQNSPEAADALEEANAKHDELRAAAKSLQPHMTRHMLLGILAALMTLLACSISITYFVGTSRWFKEVVDTYKLNLTYVTESQQIKRRSFRWSVLGALAILGVVGLGAAAEPTWANAQHSQTYVMPHYLAALAAIALLIVSFVAQFLSLDANSKLIETVMGDVRRIRQERGLAVERGPLAPREESEQPNGDSTRPNASLSRSERATMGEGRGEGSA
jgi:hypothetical protein